MAVPLPSSSPPTPNSSTYFFSSVVSWWRSYRALGRNVRLNIEYSALSSFASSIVSGSVFLSSYIFFLEGGGNSNDDVGFVSAVSGITMMILSLPIGYLTDKYPRHILLKIGGVIGLISCAALFVALVLSSMPVLYAASALSGIYSAVSGPAASSIFADSVPSGERTALYTMQYSLSLASGAAGPLIGVFFFLWLGDEWKTYQLRTVMLAGNVVNVISCFYLFFFHDDHSLGAESEGVLASTDGGNGNGGEEKKNTEKDHRNASAAGVSVVVDDDETGNGGKNTTPLLENEHEVVEDQQQPLLLQHTTDIHNANANDDATDGLTLSTTPPTTSTSNLGHQTLNLGFFTLRVKHIPYIIFLSDMSISIGAGMTVQYFALFFANDYKLSPVQTAAIWVGSPLLIAAVCTLSMPASKRWGRALVALLCDIIGTASLFALSYHSPIGVAIPLYLLRTAAMNASYPVQKAILMDVVSKKDRGKWNSLENITSFTWTGSAALGGWLIDAHGYGFTFFITGAIYVLACFILALLLPLTWGEKVDGGETKKKEVV